MGTGVASILDSWSRPCFNCGMRKSETKSEGKVKVRALTTGGKQPEIVQAVRNDRGTWFVDTLGKRWHESELISWWKVEVKV